MEFIKYDAINQWFELRDGYLYTPNGEHYSAFDCPLSTYSRKINHPDWHHLYLETGYVPNRLHAESDAESVQEWWVREDGLDIIGDARSIAIYLHGIDTPVADEWLEAMGWVRIRANSSWCREQKRLGKYKNVTEQQKAKIEDIAASLEIYPENILEWEGTYA